MQDRRKIARWQVNKPVKIKLEGGQAYMPCQLRDINFKGMQVCLAPRLPKDIVFQMQLVISDELTLDMEVWVAWHRAIDGRNLYGLYFAKLRDSDKEKIYKFVYQHVPQEIIRHWWKDLPKEEGGERMQDRRVFARIVAQLPLKFLDLNRGKEGTAKTCDISAKGVGLVDDMELAPHTPVELWLEIPDQGEPLYTRGEVVWSKMVEPGVWRSGINLEKADLMGLSRVLRSI